MSTTSFRGDGSTDPAVNGGRARVGTVTDCVDSSLVSGQADARHRIYLETRDYFDGTISIERTTQSGAADSSYRRARISMPGWNDVAPPVRAEARVDIRPSGWATVCQWVVPEGQKTSRSLRITKVDAAGATWWDRTFAIPGDDAVEGEVVSACRAALGTDQNGVLAAVALQREGEAARWGLLLMGDRGYVPAGQIVEIPLATVSGMVRRPGGGWLVSGTVVRSGSSLPAVLALRVDASVDAEYGDGGLLVLPRPGYAITSVSDDLRGGSWLALQRGSLGLVVRATARGAVDTSWARAGYLAWTLRGGSGLLVEAVSPRRVLIAAAVPRPGPSYRQARVQQRTA